MTVQQATEVADDAAYAAAVRALRSGAPLGAGVRDALAGLLRAVDRAVTAGQVPTAVAATHTRVVRLLGETGNATPQARENAGRAL